MKLSERLIQESRDIWAQYYTHPFVAGMADGTLDKDKFRYYMLQDYLYLVDYARVFALGAAKAKDLDSMMIFSGYVHQILYGEMEIHRDYMKKLGITENEAANTEASLETESYTAYMLKTAYEEGPAEIAAVILACAVSYELIANRMLEDHPGCASHPFYGEWIRGYTDPNYHAQNEVLKLLTDRLAQNYTEPQIKHLSGIFRLCSEYELRFWDMGWNAPVRNKKTAAARKQG